MHIERASISDAATILSMQYLAYQSEAEIYNDPTIPPLQQTLAELKAEFATHTFLRAISNGQLVGSVRALQQGETCLIGRLMVLPAQQSCGIGTALIDQIEREHPTAQRFELFTGSRSV